MYCKITEINCCKYYDGSGKCLYESEDPKHCEHAMKEPPTSGQSGLVPVMSCGEFRKIDSAPLCEKVLLYWENSRHIEDGEIREDEFGMKYHILFDGERLNIQPSHWARMPKLPK